MEVAARCLPAPARAGASGVRAVSTGRARGLVLAGLPGQLFSRHFGTGASSRLSSSLSFWQGESDVYGYDLISALRPGCSGGSSAQHRSVPWQRGSVIYIALMFSCQSLLKCRLLCVRFSSLGNPLKYLLALLTCELSRGRVPSPSPALCSRLVPASCPLGRRFAPWSFPGGEENLDKSLRPVGDQRRRGALRDGCAAAELRPSSGRCVLPGLAPGALPAQRVPGSGRGSARRWPAGCV